MRIALKLIACLFGIFCSTAFGGEEINYTRENDIENEKLIEEIKNNISKSLFFRGEVADAIIESNLVGKITQKEFKTYAEMRDYLIRWIEQNPQQAAAMYSFKGKDNKIKIPTEVNYFIPYWEINPYFKELIENLKKIADDKTLSDEELRLGGTRLFEGFINYGEGRIDISGNLQNEVMDYKEQKNYFANYKVDNQALNRESENIKNIYNDFEKEMRNFKTEKIFSTKKILHARYLDFLLLLAEIKGRKNLNKDEAFKLEKIRKDIRRYFISMKLLIFASDLRNILENLSEGILKYDIEKFIRVIEGEAETILTDENLALAYSFLKQSYEIYTNFKKELFFWQGISKINFDASQINFSCLYDYIFFRLYVFFKENNIYAQKRKKIAENLAFLKEVEKKSLERKIAFLNQQELKTIGEKMLETRKDIEIVRKISQINRRQQFFMWEIFWPFGIKKENGKNILFLNFLDSFMPRL